ncbi:MAG: WYL domain-containing protein [Bacteroidales bacterium]|nr:WYL domain-containing protein [Bacteroidales bacterium]
MMAVGRKQLVRLIRLVAQLKENRYPNCSSFAAELRQLDLDENLNVACTAKTVARDIAVLKRDFDAPIAFDSSQNGYYLTDHDWTFSCPQIFDETCMLSAVLGARVAEHIFPQPLKQQIRDAVDFLLTNNNPSFLDTTQVNSLVVIPSNRAPIDANVFMPLFLAWQRHEICRISYTDSRGNDTERNFEPPAVIFYDGVWYAKGFCHKRKEMRTLALPRMKSVILSGVNFRPDPKIVATANEEGLFDHDMVSDVVVHCDDQLAKIIQTRPLHHGQKVVECSKGGCDIRVKRMTRFHLVTWVMRQCGRATIIQPDDCRAEVVEFAHKILQNIR